MKTSIFRRFSKYFFCILMKSSHSKPFIVIICGFIKPSNMIFLCGNVKFLEMKIGKIPYITIIYERQQMSSTGYMRPLEGYRILTLWFVTI